MIKISFLGSSAKENNFFMAHWFSGKVCVLLGRDCYFERHVALFCRYYHVRYLGWSSHSCVKSLSSFFFFLAKTYLTMPFMLTFSAIIYYANWPVLICQAKMHWVTFRHLPNLNPYLGRPRLIVKFTVMIQTSNLICRTMPPSFVLMQVHDHLGACFLERRELWEAKMNYVY